MAQGRDAERLLNAPAKAATARIFLAVAVAVALTVSSCGGDDSSEEPTVSASTSASTQSSEGKSGESKGGSSRSTAEQLIDRGSGLRSAADAAAGSAGQASDAQGTHVAIPEGTPEPKITAEQRAKATVVSISFHSPALRGGQGSTATLPPAHTCDGENTWPAMRWDDVPPDTEELALVAMSVQPVEGEIFVDWAVSGLDPSLGGIEAGRLPGGAVMGRNSAGDVAYSICPPPRKSETYIFALYALPQKLSQRRGFDPLALREQASRLSRDAGVLAATYTRG